MPEHEDKPDETFSEAEPDEEERTGWIGGGGPASTTEDEDPKERERDARLADTEH